MMNRFREVKDEKVGEREYNIGGISDEGAAGS